MTEGLRAAGVDVVDVGIVPTPLTYWAEATFDVAGSVQITGSHNPPEWNGIKMTVGRASLYGDAIQKLRRRIVEGDFASGRGGLEREEILDRYVADVAGRFALERPIEVAVDCGNGTGSLVAVPTRRSTGGKMTSPAVCSSRSKSRPQTT